MWLKRIFSIPAEQKVTEKHLRRVLIASVCSILLCMSCLAGTTWALFVVTMENEGNIIQIGTPEVVLTVNGQEFVSGSELPEGEHKVSIKHANDLDALQEKSILYVTLTIDDAISVYTTLDQQNNYSTDVTVIAERPCSFSWTVTWFKPINVKDALQGENAISIVDENVTAPTDGEMKPAEEEDLAEGTTTPAETSEPSAGITPPTETPDPSEGTTTPTEATEPSEGITEPTEEMVSTEETSAPATEPIKGANATEPTDAVVAEAGENASA